MESSNAGSIRLPTVHPAVTDFLTGPTGTKSTAAKKSVGNQNKVKGSRVDKAKGNTGRSRGLTAKKAVNNYIIFRSMMSPVFPNYTQADRSRFIRAMWEKEQQKTSYGLMARVWTFIRDNSNFKNLPMFLAGAGIICGITSPEVWLSAYNMTLVNVPDGTVQLLQVHDPGQLPSANDLTDFDLLRGLLMKGLPVERPAQLLQMMAEHSLHIMTINKKYDLSAYAEDLGETGRAVVGFTAQMNYNPITTFADMLNITPDNSLFDFGLNVIDVEDITNFDHSLIGTTGTHTQFRHEWDTTTAHQARSNGALDIQASEEANKVYDLDQANMWGNISGQMSQREYDTGNADIDPDLNLFNMNLDFTDEFTTFDLQ